MSTETLEEHFNRLFKSIKVLHQEIEDIKLFNEKVAQDIEYIRTNFEKNEKKQPIKKKSPSVSKTKILSNEETENYKKQFLDLFEKWMSGEELYVRNTLEEYDVQDLRNFADANNLNVTSKMPKQRVLHLIDARFREKKMILK